MVSRLINEPITVHVGKNSAVSAFIWRNRLYSVGEIISWWREPSKWWEGEPSIRLLIRASAPRAGAWIETRNVR